MAQAPARLTVLVALAAALAAGGGCGGSNKLAAEPSADDPCVNYQIAIAPSLERLEEWLDQFQEAPSNSKDVASAARRLAEQIDDELVELRQIENADAAIAAAHGDLVLGLERASSALGALSSAFAIGDEGAYLRARAQLEDALATWATAAKSLSDRCG